METTLSWNPYPSGEPRYDLWRDGQVIATNIEGTSYTDADVSPGVTYTYEIVPTGWIPRSAS